MNNEDYEAEMCHLMATDELNIYQEISLAEEFEAFFDAFEQRRKRLNQLDSYRVTTLAYQPDKILAVFKRLNLPFNLKLPKQA